MENSGIGMEAQLIRRAVLDFTLMPPSIAELVQARGFVRELNLFRARQMTPLVFAAWEKMSREDFVRTPRLVSILSFRYTVVGSRNPSALEPAYHFAAKSLLAGESMRPADLFQKLRPMHIDDIRFKSDFALLTIDTSRQRRKLAKYIPARPEQDASGRPCDPEIDPATVEHILPENPSEEWVQAFPCDQWAAALSRSRESCVPRYAMKCHVQHSNHTHSS
jgi:hypothetical protein